jgi:hypothetical protein
MASLAFLRFAVERLINGSADKAERDALLEAVENGNLIFARGERAVAVGGSVHGAIVTGNNNLVLSLDETNVEILRRTLSALFAASAAGSQPPLDLPVLDPNEQNRFVYGAQRIPFIGRAADLGACGDFLKNEGLFRWWLLLGSGGAGKSRLALELCLRMQDGWRTGFLPHRHGFVGWSSWQPEKPTLLVADYAGERAGDVRDLIVALAGRRNLAFPGAAPPPGAGECRPVVARDHARRAGASRHRSRTVRRATPVATHELRRSMAGDVGHVWRAQG